MIDAIDEIAHREKKSRSQLVKDILKEYAEAHQDNSQSRLDCSIRDSTFRAFPTIWDSNDFSTERLKDYSSKEMLEMKWKLENGLSKLNSVVALAEQNESQSDKGPIKQSDISWFMSTRNWTRDQAVAYLISLGYSHREGEEQ